MGCAVSRPETVGDVGPVKGGKSAPLWRDDSADELASTAGSGKPSLEVHLSGGYGKAGASGSKSSNVGPQRDRLMDSAGSLEQEKDGTDGRNEAVAAAAAMREPAAASSIGTNSSAGGMRPSSESTARTSICSTASSSHDDKPTELENWDSGGAMRRLTCRTSFSNTNQRDGSLDVDRRNSMQYMREVDSIIRSYDISTDEVQICKHQDGADVVLGRGTYGQVYHGLRDGVQDVAVKVLFETDERALRTFIQEISLLKSLNYDRNIVQFYGSKLIAGQVPMMITEFMEGGDLRTAIDEDFNGQLKWNMLGFTLALDVARGLHFLHAHNVIHSDLKTSNVLLDRSKSTAKISDVGLARVMTKKEYRLSDEHAWTFVYAAPEMLTGKPCDAKSDVYSLGVVLWELVMRERPVRGKLSKPSAPDDCPEAVAGLISRCLKKDPALRPTAKEVFSTIKEAHSSVICQSTW